MTLLRPSRSDDHLSNYWNALVRNAPAEELARLARLVEPSEIAAIERARAAHQRHEPDPTFARRLEQTLMNTAISPIAGTIPQPRVSPPSRNGTRDPGPAYPSPPPAPPAPPPGPHPAAARRPPRPDRTPAPGAGAPAPPAGDAVAQRLAAAAGARHRPGGPADPRLGRGPLARRQSRRRAAPDDGA